MSLYNNINSQFINLIINLNYDINNNDYQQANNKSIELLNLLKNNYNNILILISYINNNPVNDKLKLYITYIYNKLLENNLINISNNISNINLNNNNKIYIASMNMRGKWAELIDKNSIKINVTSAQGKDNKNRRDFSPMTEIVGGYKGFWCFENYWQSGKVFEGIPMETTKIWWKSLKEAKRRYPGSKGKKVLYATWPDVEINGKTKLDYVESRKKVYVPEYYNLIKDREMLKFWRDELQKGKSLTIYDFDGPRNQDGSVTCLPLTKELLINKINDVNFPFGHGYIVAASIANILPSEYI